jgi:mannosyltransferase OCH1-like enzyme
MHPTFVCPDIEADLRSQAREYNVNYEDLSSVNDYQYLKQRLADAPLMKIPKVIHQIYEDLAGPPEHLLKIAESWKEHNPEWEYRFWNKHDMEAFMQTYYPELIPMYEAFPHNVQRWDAIRYLILYKLGGLYVDMDYECTENITPLLYGVTCGMGLEPFGHNVRSRRPIIVGNAFMASVPGHPFMQELIDTIFFKLEDKIQQMHVMNSTGPFMVTKQYNESQCQDEVTLIPAELVAPLTQEEVIKVMNSRYNKFLEDKIEQSYAIHYFLGSWYR